LPDRNKRHVPTAGGFDPFNDRPSRTVRNTLSKRLQDCLAREEIFPRAPEDLLARFPQRPYRDYIRDRARRYRRATREAQTADRSPLARAGILWRHGLYFEAHEVLEPHWQASSDDTREGLKGVIQAIGVHVHREAGRRKAALSLARKAAARLQQYGSAIDQEGPLDIDALLMDLEDLIASPGERFPASQG
jgi:hypothetical protein